MRPGARRSAGAFLALALMIALALALGLVVPRPVAAPAAGGAHEIVLIANPIHTDIALPSTPPVLSRLRFLGAAGLPLDHPGLGHVLVGWGGREFYTRTPTWGELTPGAAFASVTLDDSVLRFELIPPLPADLGHTRRIVLSDAGLEALVTFIEATLARDEAGAPQVVEGAGYTPFDRFFEARGAFNILIGCNVWTSAALAAAGVSTGWWTPLPQLLFASLDLHS
ncbi:TIGR02117 family protein [Aureimonas populi]|uniref:TIGR02117 family protein n=1 Tax=Aureimonas populi TaxID=1701758 RepID=A0ABW5CPK0_9HYPH|nr:TIGR02117 family protein [Aureimonas populi]